MVDTTAAAGKCDTLAAALTKTKLVDALKEDGPFTVALKARGVTTEELLAREDLADSDGG